MPANPSRKSIKGELFQLALLALAAGWIVASVSPSSALAQGGQTRQPAALSASQPADQAAPQAPAGTPSLPAQPDTRAPDGSVAPSSEPIASEPEGSLKAVRDSFESIKLRLNEGEAILARPDLGDAQLVDLRGQVAPAISTIQDLLNRLTPRAAAAKARLDQLGPKPDANAPAEGPDTVKERDERQRDFADVNEAARIGGALLVQADQINARITNRRRILFTSALFQRNASIASPNLWMSVAQSVPGDLKAISTVGSDWLSAVRARIADGRVVPLVLAMVAALATYLVRKRVAPRVTARNDKITAPTRLRRSLAAVWRTLFAALPAALAAYFLYIGLDGSNLLPPRVDPIVQAALLGVVFVAFARALAEAMLAPTAPSWRVVDAANSTAEPLYRLVFIGSVLVVVGRVFDVMLQTIGAALASSIAAKGVFAILVAILLADTLRRLARKDECDDLGLGPYIPTEPTLNGPLRVLGWMVVAGITGSVFLGFIALATFIVEQCIWLAILAALLKLSLVIVDETIGRAFVGNGRVALTLQTSIGLRRRSLDQIAVIASGLIRVTLIVVALLLVLAFWGIESTDFVSSMRSLFFGLQVAGITLSLSTVIAAIGLFILAVAATRAIQRWLEVKYLPVTGLDSGLRNSITTAAGYFGVFVAIALALAQLGLSLDRIAIVAGALSVGIGFGLQSIVNNFVSGLILLWDRSISVGDWIVVGSEQGYVRRISVRATEIQTFERAAVIVPNSNLVSGVVKNWLRNNRTGRIAVVVTVPFQPDPTRVANLLADCAISHPDVLADPKPSVLFNKFTDSSQEFELRCFADVEASSRIKSELNYKLFERLTAEGIYSAPGIPLSEVKVHLPDDLQALIRKSARQRGKDTDPGKGEGPQTEDDPSPDAEPPAPAAYEPTTVRE